MPRKQRVRQYESDVVHASWWPKLRQELVALHDRLGAERRAADRPTSEWRAEDALATASARATVVRWDEQRAAVAPWSSATTEERAAFKRQCGTDLASVVRAAFPWAHGVEEPECEPPLSGAAMDALLTLIAWDARCLFVPSVAIAMRNAQVVDDRVSLKRLGEAVGQNRRYRAARESRGQQFITKLLLQFRFGDPRAFQGRAYRVKVFEGLREAFGNAGVPEKHQSMNMLLSPEHFDRHLRRVGLLSRRPQGHKADDSVRAAQQPDGLQPRRTRKGGRR